MPAYWLSPIKVVVVLRGLLVNGVVYEERLAFEWIFFSNGTVYPGGMFSEKGNTFSRHFFFLAFPGILGNLCTICPHLPVPGSSE